MQNYSFGGLLHYSSQPPSPNPRKTHSRKQVDGTIENHRAELVAVRSEVRQLEQPLLTATCEWYDEITDAEYIGVQIAQLQHTVDYLRYEVFAARVRVINESSEDIGLQATNAALPKVLQAGELQNAFDKILIGSGLFGAEKERLQNEVRSCDACESAMNFFSGVLCMNPSLRRPSL